MVKGVEDAGGFSIPRPLEGEECRAFLDAKCAELDVRPAAPARVCRSAAARSRVRLASLYLQRRRSSIRPN